MARCNRCIWFWRGVQIGREDLDFICGYAWKAWGDIFQIKDWEKDRICAMFRDRREYELDEEGCVVARKKKEKKQDVEWETVGFLNETKTGNYKIVLINGQQQETIGIIRRWDVLRLLDGRIKGAPIRAQVQE